MRLKYILEEDKLNSDWSTTKDFSSNREQEITTYLLGK